MGLEYMTKGDLKNNLMTLDLDECDKISDIGIGHLKQMVNPTHLSLSKYGVNITDSGIMALSQLSNIEWLDLSWFINVTDISLSQIATSRYTIFDENRLSSIPRAKIVVQNLEESQRDDHSDNIASEIPEPRKEDPRTYNQAMQSQDATSWKEIINDEIGSIIENNTWVISDLPLGCKPLDCKWIFKRKMKVDRTIDKFKARLTTFLNGDLDEEVYMKQPKGFVMPGNEHKLIKLRSFLSSRFSMKDMGEADVILGIKIIRENKGIVITQSHYIEKILKKFNREDCSPVSTPMDLVEKLKPNIGKPVDHLEYSRAIGCLMYAMTRTRPDIAYVVGRLSRFTRNPSRQHWKAIIKVFKYLRGTKDYGLSYVGYPSVLEGYSDASWIKHVEDSSSTSGWVFLLGDVSFHGLPRSKYASLVQTWNLCL
nr:zinc finger, CCHC-type [Tanacetum cinerariifolium]